MPMPDVFNGDAFNMVSLTTAINKLPYVPNRIGQMGLFTEQGVATNTVAMEQINGVISLLPSKPRGTAGTTTTPEARTMRSLDIPHIPHDATILASAIQGVREFGSENQLSAVNKVVNDTLTRMRRSHELTHEWLRMGAIKGIVLDGDGSTTLYNLFTVFGVSQPPDVDFLLGADTTDIATILLGVVETIEAALGAESYDHIHCFCNSTWFKKFVAHPQVKYAYQYFQEGRALREDMRKGFEFMGVTFEVYRGTVNSTPFVADDECQFFPVGVPDLFMQFNGPADFVETVNTIGLPVYAKQKVMDFDRGIEIHTQSNPLCICTRPGVLVQGISSN